jgi:hypothetical protein
MCDPVSASIALTASGTAAQAYGQSKARSAIAAAQAAERERQHGFQNQANDFFSQSLSNASAGTQAGQQAGHQADRKSAYDTATAAVAPVDVSNKSQAGDQNANTVVSTDTAKESAKAMNTASLAGDAAAALQGFGDQQAANDIYNKRMLQRQAQLGNFMQGSASVLPYEVEAASHKGDQFKNVGDLLSLGGSVVGMGAGAGWWDKPSIGSVLAKNNAALNLSNPSTMTTISDNFSNYNKSLLPNNPFYVAPPAVPNPFSSAIRPAMFSFK